MGERPPASVGHRHHVGKEAGCGCVERTREGDTPRPAEWPHIGLKKPGTSDVSCQGGMGETASVRRAGKVSYA